MAKFDVNDPEKQFPIGCGGVYDAAGERLSPVVSCDTATGEVTRYVMTPDGKFTIGEDKRLATVTEMRPAPLRIEVRPVDVESQYQLAKSSRDNFARRGVFKKVEFKGPFHADPASVAKAKELVEKFENGGVMCLPRGEDSGGDYKSKWEEPEPPNV